MQLYKRDIFDKIRPYLGDETIIVLVGARQVGKTHILYYIKEHLTEQGEKVWYYDLEFPELLSTLNRGVEPFISDLKSKGYMPGEKCFVLIDEIQYLDNPSSFLKLIADHYKQIHLVVSGSSTFDIKSKFTDSLAGRTTPFDIFPLSFVEYLRFTGSPYTNIRHVSDAGISHLSERYREFIRYGAYPKVALEPRAEKKKQYLVQLIDTYIRKDIRDLADVGDIRKFNNMLKVLASQSGQLLNMSALSREITLSLPTVSKYLSVLEETFVVKRIAPYSKSPSVEITKNPKLFFYDSGLMSILWFNAFQETVLGSVMETAVFGELVKAYGRNNVSFWRTKTDQEIDFIVTKETGKFAAIEVKMNFGQFTGRSMRSFVGKYALTDWAVVALMGIKPDTHAQYPWEAT